MAVLALLADREQQPQAGRKEVLDIGDDHVPQRRQPRADRLEPGEERRQADDNAGFRIGQLMLELGLDIQGARRDHDRASAQATVVGDYHLRAVRHEQRHPIAFLDAERDQRVGEAIGLGVELAIGDRATKEADRGSTRIALRGCRQRGVQWFVGQIDLGGHARVIRRQPRSVVLLRHWSARVAHRRPPLALD